MPIATTSIYTCDRDGTVSEPVAGGLPAGWTTMQFMETRTTPPQEGQPPLPPMMVSTSVVMCPACTASFSAFRKGT